MICRSNVIRSVWPLLLALCLVNSMNTAHASGSFAYQVGAAGSPDSIGNVGIRAEIRTHIYHVYSTDQDGFWVGDFLSSGAFIQFGYVIPPQGTYCPSGEIGGSIPLSCPSESFTVNGSQVLWLWQYWPRSDLYHFYFGWRSLGPASINGTWNSYALLPDTQGYWQFLINGQRVATANFTAQPSISAARMVAEKTGFSDPNPLGPVEFRDLAYLRQDAWHSVTALYAIVYCTASVTCLPVPYGVALEGPNHIIAGLSIAQPKDGELLWTSTELTQTGAIESTTSSVMIVSVRSVIFYGALIVAALVVVFAFKFVVRLKQKRVKKRRWVFITVL